MKVFFSNRKWYLCCPYVCDRGPRSWSNYCRNYNYFSIPHHSAHFSPTINHLHIIINQCISDGNTIKPAVCTKLNINFMIIILDRRDAMTRDLSTIELILEWAKEAMQPTERAMTQCFFKGWDSKHIF